MNLIHTPQSPPGRPRPPRRARAVVWRAALAAVAVLVCLAAAAPVAGQKKNDPEAARREEQEMRERWRKWMEEEVAYIITDEEKALFNKLTTDEERDRFVEDFWRRRDPEPRTPVNEYKMEYYRRIAYTNDHYASGVAGWRSDRGRVYITLGPPDSIETHPAGSFYESSDTGHGGSTLTYPIQVWYYRHVPWIGDDVKIEFVDKSSSGAFRLLSGPLDRLDALNVAPTMLTDELLGRYDTGDLAYLGYGANQSLDKRYELFQQYAALQRAPKIRFDDLKQRVSAHAYTQAFPMSAQGYPLWMTPDQAVVPLSVEIENRHLSYEQKGDTYQARVNVYVLIEALDGRIAAEFDDDTASTYRIDTFDGRLTEKTVYQRFVLLPAGRYKLNLAVKDTVSGHVTVREQSLHIPALPADGLALSGLILARTVLPATPKDDPANPFLIGQYKVIPNVSGAYRADDRLAVYGQIYQPGRDDAAPRPQFSVRFEIRRGDEVLLTVEDPAGRSVKVDGPDRFVFMRGLPLDDLAAGRYELRVTVEDAVGGASATTAGKFVKE
jgi:GWxTD domain-containing protein